MNKAQLAVLMMAAGNSLNHVLNTLLDKDAFPVSIMVYERIGGRERGHIRIRTFAEGEAERKAICVAICCCDAPVLKIIPCPARKLDLRYWHVNVKNYVDDTKQGEGRILARPARIGWRGGYS